jgi:ArsR family transcriptional regulator
MAAPGGIEVDAAVAALKAAADQTRLRILLLLSDGELNVKDFTRILGQSQPRISRHVKLLGEAGLVERVREGSWVFCRLAEGSLGELARGVVASIDQSDAIYTRDRQRADGLKTERQDVAQDYFRSHAADWDRIRALHVSEAEVEHAMREVLGSAPVDLLIDLGTGTGRTLEFFADQYARGVGIDVNPSMLAYARSKLSKDGLSHVQVRHGDIYNLSFADEAADTVIMHQVLHFLSDPAHAIHEAARVLGPGGRLLIVDFAPHSLEFLREQYAHERLGFSHAQVKQWLSDAGLAVRQVRDLEPPSENASDKLTVSIWLAERPGQRKHPAASVRAQQLQPVRSAP